MKILHINDHYGPLGGVETYLHTLMPLLQAYGHQNILIYRKKTSQAIDRFDESIYYIPETNNPIGDREKILNIILGEKPDIVYLHYVSDPILITQIAKTIPTIGYVHIFYPVCPGLGKLYRRGDNICGHRFNLQCLIDIYHRRCSSARNPMTVFRIFNSARQLLLAYKSLPKVLVASNYMYHLLIQNGLSEECTAVLPLFITIPDEKDLTKPKSALDYPSIFFAGRLEYEKGLPYLIKAFAYINNSSYLIIGGDGSLKSSYIQLVRNLNIADRVKFTGWLSKNDLYAQYRRSSVVGMPTIMPEPFGLVGIEAMANSRPVIAFDVGGISDWLKDGYNGYLVTSRDIGQLANRLDKVLGDPSLAIQLGMNGRSSVEEKFVAHNHIERLLRIMVNVI